MPACTKESDPREEERKVRNEAEKTKVKNKMDSADEASLFMRNSRRLRWK